MFRVLNVCGFACGVSGKSSQYNTFQDVNKFLYGFYNGHLSDHFISFEVCRKELKYQGV